MGDSTCVIFVRGLCHMLSCRCAGQLSTIGVGRGGEGGGGGGGGGGRPPNNLRGGATYPLAPPPQ